MRLVGFENKTQVFHWVAAGSEYIFWNAVLTNPKFDVWFGFAACSELPVLCKFDTFSFVSDIALRLSPDILFAVESRCSVDGVISEDRVEHRDHHHQCHHHPAPVIRSAPAGASRALATWWQ